VSLRIGSRLRRICSRNGLHPPGLGRRPRSGARVEAPLATFPLANQDPVANLKKWADALEDVDPYRLFLDSGTRP